MQTKGFFTIAFGEKYRKIASNLLKSYKFVGGGYPFAIVTDKEDANIKKFDNVIVCAPLRNGFMNKLNIDNYAPFDISIFIDADCLIAKNIDYYFDLFEKHSCPVSVFGWNIDIETTLKNPNKYYFQYAKTKHLNIETIPSFNGGLYYIEQGDNATRVFDEARQFADNKPDYGFIWDNGDEPYIALAMAKNGCRCLCDEQILVFHRATIYELDIRNSSFSYEQWGRKLDDVGIVHFGNVHTKGWLYKYLVSDIKQTNKYIYKLLYETGVKKCFLKTKSKIRETIIKFLVKIKHFLLP